MLRQTQSLVESGLFDRIEIGAMWRPGLPEEEWLDAKRHVWRVRLWTARLPGTPGKALRFLEWYLRLLIRYRRTDFAFVNCHSLSALPLGVLFQLLRGSGVIYDTHELETETQSSVGVRRRLAKLVEKSLIRRAHVIFVVTESIADWYRNT